MRAALRHLSAIPVFVACIALFVLMVMTFADVLLRSVLNAPIEAATELTRILMAVVVFSVLPIISARGEHIEVDLADPVFDRLGLHDFRVALIKVICGALLYWPVQRLWVLMNRAREYGDTTEYLSIPVFYVTGFICAATAVTAIVMVLTGLAQFIVPSLQEPDQ